MKEKITYVAFDDTEFSTKQDCIDYEKEGYQNEILRVSKRLQQLKSNELSDEFETYKRALNNYRKVCTTKTNLYQRSAIINRYFAEKEKYEKTLTYFKKLRTKLSFLKKKEEEATKHE